MAELKLTNNPCKYCNGEIDEGKTLCGDIVNEGERPELWISTEGKLFFKNWKKEQNEI